MMNLFDLLPQEESDKFKPIKSTDWKWSFKDYPPKNGLKVFSCFACGGEAKVVLMPCWGYTAYNFLCTNKKCNCSIGSFDTEEEAINAWNTRVESKPKNQEV